MTKEIIEKLAKPGTPLELKDVSVEKKKRLITFLNDKGFTTATFYLRFFRKGFDLWELEGIQSCREQFLALPDIGKLLLEYVEKDALGNELGAKGYLYTLAKSDKTGIFYTCLKKIGRCTRFCEFMEERGMSKNVAFARFTSDNWKPWEMEGIIPLLNHFNDIQKTSEDGDEACGGDNSSKGDNAHEGTEPDQGDSAE